MEASRKHLDPPLEVGILLTPLPQPEAQGPVLQPGVCTACTLTLAHPTVPLGPRCSARFGLQDPGASLSLPFTLQPCSPEAPVQVTGTTLPFLPPGLWAGRAGHVCRTQDLGLV